MANENETPRPQDPRHRESRDMLLRSHTPEAIADRLAAGPEHSYLKDFVYGAIDGTVTTFAVVSGVAGAQLSSGIVLVLGLANLLGDGFSMAVSNFLGTRSEEELRERIRRREEWHVRVIPEGEREEIRQIFAAKGFEGEDLERVVDVITSDVQQWVDTMVAEEYGLGLAGPSPWRAALSTFTAFVLVGFLPLVSFVLTQLSVIDAARAFTWSAAMTAVTFFLIGAAKGRVVHGSWYRSGVETLFVGGSAAAIAYIVGLLLRGIAD
ncbi:MAG TPA: VIT1/CCC1 transporter family protein [Planctomycetota bacterium]|nr:VIT1/CCC1 transporter family protein [Planctomycetota bacterium]